MSSAEERPETGRLELDEPAPGVARLTITNPTKRGALDHAILDAFVELIPRLDQRCLIITGQERIFSAGYDLVSAGADLAEADEASFAERAEGLIAHPFTAAIEAVESFPFPTLAVLNGHAIGGGLELAVCCDLRLAAAGIRVGMPPAHLGLVYSHTGIRRFIETVGAARPVSCSSRPGAMTPTPRRPGASSTTSSPRRRSRRPASPWPGRSPASPRWPSGATSTSSTRCSPAPGRWTPHARPSSSRCGAPASPPRTSVRG